MSELVNILEIEPANRLDDDIWTQDVWFTNLWHLTHTPGKPSRVEENGVELTEQASAEEVHDNPGSWIWGADAALDSREDIGTYNFGITEFYSYGGKRAEKYWNSFYPNAESLYIHTTGSDDPAGGAYIILAFFWEYLTVAQYVDEDIIFNGNEYLPYLNVNDIPDIINETSGYQKGGLRQSFGSVRIINADGRYDSRLTDYIYEAKKIILKAGIKGGNYASYDTYWIGWTGGIGWSEEEIEIDIEDLRTQHA